MTHLRTVWQGRNQRERTMLSLGAIVLSVLFIYAFVWEPASAGHKRLRGYLPQLRAQAAQVSADAAEAQRLRSRQLASRVPSTPAAVEAVAEQARIRANITSLTERPEGRLQLVLKAVPYDALVSWLGVLPASAGFVVESVQLRAGAAPGMVEVESLVLRAASA